MKKEQFLMNGLHAVIWQPEGDVKALLQVAHGMTEHIGRYEDFAAELCGRGIAVAGFDLRGHGRNPGGAIASCGEGGWEASVGEIRSFGEELDRRFPECPRYVLGFSLGSFLVREYLSRDPGRVAGAVIAGTGHQPGWLLSVMAALVRGERKKCGFDGTTDLVRQLSFGTYNQKFKPNRTTADWLCTDGEAVDQYLADPLVRKEISAGLFGELLESMKRSGNRRSYEGWNKSLPVLLISGQDDPVGNGGKGVTQLCGLMKRSGLEQVTLRLLPGARHDIFHEGSTGTAEEVCRCIGDWILGEKN